MQLIKLPALIKSIFNTVLEVRITDINYGNHLGHDSVIQLMHEARVRFLASLGLSELDIGGNGLILTNLIVNYKGEAFYSDKILINLSIGELSITRFNLYYQLQLENTTKEIARGMTTLTSFDYMKSKVVKIPERFLVAIKNL